MALLEPIRPSTQPPAAPRVARGRRQPLARHLVSGLSSLAFARVARRALPLLELQGSQKLRVVSLERGQNEDVLLGEVEKEDGWTPVRLAEQDGKWRDAEHSLEMSPKELLATLCPMRDTMPNFRHWAKRERGCARCGRSFSSCVAASDLARPGALALERRLFV